MKTKTEFCVINPSGHRYFFTAYDKFEAIYYAKKKDDHRWMESEYTILRKRKKNDLQNKK